MPTERFYRLPEAKKQVIRQAAIKEFARVPFEKASINQIIQNADISRGSFYTYFEDKQDVVRYIFEDNARQMQECCERELDKNDGNLFDMLEWLFEFTIRKLKSRRRWYSWCVMSAPTRKIPGPWALKSDTDRPWEAREKKKRPSGSQSGSVWSGLQDVRRRNWMLCCSLV